MERILCFVAVIMFGTVDSQFTTQYVVKTCGDGTILDAEAIGCHDTEGCRLPLCCGAVAQSPLNLTITYPAKVNANGGTVSLSIVGKLGASTNAANPILLLNTPFKDLVIPLPQAILSYNSDMCYVGPNQPFNPDFCPQTAGNVYTFSQNFSIPLPLATTAGLVVLFQLDITSGSNSLLCVQAYGRYMSPLLFGVLG